MSLVFVGVFVRGGGGGGGWGVEGRERYWEWVRRSLAIGDEAEATMNIL